MYSRERWSDYDEVSKVANNNDNNYTAHRRCPIKVFAIHLPEDYEYFAIILG